MAGRVHIKLYQKLVITPPTKPWTLNIRGLDSYKHSAMDRKDILSILENKKSPQEGPMEAYIAALHSNVDVPPFCMFAILRVTGPFP
jgi:hypothetical protein